MKFKAIVTNLNGKFIDDNRYEAEASNYKLALKRARNNVFDAGYAPISGMVELYENKVNMVGDIYPKYIGTYSL